MSANFYYFLSENMKQEIEDEASRIMSEADSLINLSQPRLTKEEVVLCTEQITKRIQELLLAAQAGRHNRFVLLILSGYVPRLGVRTQTWYRKICFIKVIDNKKNRLVAWTAAIDLSNFSKSELG